MIQTVVKISILRLWNTKQELLLIFVVPVLFFSIFALIFSRGVGHKPKQVRLSIVNDDHAPMTDDIVRSLGKMTELRKVTGVGKTDSEWPIERLSRALISGYNAEVVVYFPSGYSDALRSSEPKSVQILNEGTNPVSARVVEALLAQTIATAYKPALPSDGLIASNRSDSQVMLASAVTAVPSDANLSNSESIAVTSGPGMQFEKLNVFASNKHQPKIAMYAAGIAVMFLLFSSSGAGASLLEEKEAGTLGRLMTSKLTVTELLIGKWTYIALLGLVQISTMFVWGQLVFNVDLLGHLPGFFVMAVATSCASASFALFLASVCRTRNQLNGISMVVVLGMSAIGGSMIPRYVMSESMQRLGKFTFNGWALDGFKKIFWYDLPVSAVKTEVFVLMMIAIIFAFAAHTLVRRWSIA